MLGHNNLLLFPLLQNGDNDSPWLQGYCEESDGAGKMLGTH